ncbi:MAG: L,D-transpeptidase family protein, partial [Ruminiclostridium sp.]|nr:L,D-transpeptidase family protein [Ruminiclostridium sp.]
TIQGTGTIDRLILAARTGDVDLQLPAKYTVGTLTIGDGKGDVSCSGTISNVEVTGSDREITIDSSLNTLAISGNGNTIKLENGCTVDKIIIRGTENTLKLNADADSLLLAGRDNKISGTGHVKDVVLNTKYYDLNTPADKVTPWTDYDIAGVSVSLSAPQSLPAGGVLRAAASITAPDSCMGKLCTGLWYLNGDLMQEQPILLGKDTPVSSFVPNYKHNMNLNGDLEFVLRYEDSDGDAHDQKASATVQLASFSDLGLADTTITLDAPDTLPAGRTLKVTAAVDSPERGIVCRGVWYVDGKDVASGPVTLGSSNPSLAFCYDYYYGMPEKSTVELALYYTTQDGRQQEVRQSKKITVENYADNGISKAVATLNAPATLEAGATLSVTADLWYPEAGKTCTADWYVDGQKVSSQTIVLGTKTPQLTHKYTYTENMKTTSELRFVLSYTTQDGRAQQVSAVKTIQLKNYGYQYYHNISEADVLRMVTNTYAGDYTLAWALNHDYDPEIKTAWVNLKGYSSNTQYLVWVNLTYQRVNIFQGYQGNWKLIRSCLCGSGKNSTPTIKGVFTTSYKQQSWNYGSYYCGPIVRFNGSSGYAFHSRLEYWPMNSDRYYDARIGFPVSHGCLRMYNDDIWFMYYNIPNGTTVVVH